MSERNLELEMDELKKDLQEIKELLRGGKQKINYEEDAEEDSDEEQVFTRSAFAQTVYTSDIPAPEINLPEMHAMRENLEKMRSENGESGRITCVGSFESNGRRSMWIKNQQCTDGLLELIESGLAVKVLNCIGNNDRLNILLAILKKPMTVAELVASGGYNSTGQVYHHLKPLIAADLVEEDRNNYDKGTYVVLGHKVQGIIMLLAGINDMIDINKGDWEEADKPGMAFEFIMKLPDTIIQKLLTEVEYDILLALKNAREELKEVFFKNMSKQRADIIREDIEYVRASARDIEAAKQRIINKVLEIVEREGFEFTET